MYVCVCLGGRGGGKGGESGSGSTLFAKQGVPGFSRTRIESLPDDI